MTLRNLLVTAMALGAGLPVGDTHQVKAEDTTVYELRTYTAAPGKMPELQKRFRRTHVQIFESIGMKTSVYGLLRPEPAR